jgi:formylglycine-generating enzyme required for sulfatase activity
VDSGELRDVGATPQDRTATGIADLAGNLPEWVDDSPPGSQEKIVRGGGYYLPAEVAGERLTTEPASGKNEGYLRVGFRCAAR